MTFPTVSNKSYAEQRKNRLQDAVDDYINDNNVSILEFYHDLKDCVSDIMTFHNTGQSRAEGVLQLITGHRPNCGLEDDIDQVDVSKELNNMPTIPSRY